jgi:hypothetical protein
LHRSSRSTAHGTPCRGGLGLGLAIVGNLVDRHGGAVSAYSEGLGRGASFAVELPTVAAVDEPIRPPPGTQARRWPWQRALLVVDDNVDLAEMMSQALQFEGFQTARARHVDVCHRRIDLKLLKLPTTSTPTYARGSARPLARTVRKKRTARAMH